MIKIVFNPFYGSHVYLDMKDRNAIIGVKHMGASALVGELRLRAGLTSVLPDAMERAALYMKAISSVLKKSDNSYVEIFRQSFDKDKLGVATTLLGWRDTLVGLGWSPTDYTKSQKLNALIDIEEAFHSPGVADCKRELLLVLESGQVSLSDVSIESVLPLEFLPCYFSRLLQAASSCGANITYSEQPISSAPDGTALRKLQDYLLLGNKVNQSEIKKDDSLKVYRFCTADDALKYAALSSPSIIAANDTVLLREIFRAMNLPLPMVESAFVPQVVKLLPLALSLRKQHVDVDSLLAFLSVEPNPLSSLKVKCCVEEEEWYISINRILRDILLKEGGFNEQWYAVLEGDLYNKGGELIKKTQRAKVLKLISVVPDSDGMITNTELTELLELLIGWSTKDLENRGVLLQYCRFAQFLTDGMSESFDVESLIRWLSSANVPQKSIVMPAEVGSCEVSNTPSSVVDGVDSMCWSDCWVGNGRMSELDFLSPVDIAELGFTVDTAEKIYKAQRYSLSLGLSKVRKQLVILTCDKVGGESVQAHPLLVELKSCCGLSEDFATIDAFVSEFPTTGLSQRQIEHTVDAAHFKGIRLPKSEGGLRRTSESYSSLNTLINFPFEYVMKYLLHWDAYGVDSMPEMATVKGNVAHRYIEELFIESDKDIIKAKSIHAQKYSDRVEQCILKHGAIMHLDENRLDTQSYRVRLNEAVNSLLHFIESNRLTVVGMEYPIDIELPVIGSFNGKIDLLLADDRGHLVVVDMKWNEGSTYKRRLENGDTLQLSLYKKALEAQDNTVVCEGYFVLPQRKFFTSSAYFQPSLVVEVITNDSVADLFELACNSYEYRMGQIARGVIEDGEGALLADIQYHKDMLSKRLYPLCKDYNDATIKGAPYGNPNPILKGGLL